MTTPFHSDDATIAQPLGGRPVCRRTMLARVLGGTASAAAGGLFLAVARADEPLARSIEWREPLKDPQAKPGEVPFSLLSGPILGWLSDTGATIGWEVIARKGLTEPFAESLRLPGETDLNKDLQFRSVTLKGLKPDTRYQYALTSSDGAFRYTGKTHAFRTLPGRAATKVRFAVIGDTHATTGPDQAWADVNRRLFKSIHAWDPPLVLHVGDIVHDSWGFRMDGRRGWPRFFALGHDVCASALMAPALGNHDIKAGQHVWAPSYFANLAAQQHNKAGEARPPYYYSFDAAHVHFVALCTELRPKSDRKGDPTDAKFPELFGYDEQLAWLEADLRGTSAPWKIAFFHQPLHTVGRYPCRPEFQRDFGRLFDRYGVAVVISGHDHSYQRTWRIDNATRRRADRGSVQIISGGAAYPFKRHLEADWNVLHASVLHYLRIQIDGDTLRAEAVLDDDKVLESWEMKATGQPVALNRS